MAQTFLIDFNVLLVIVVVPEIFACNDVSTIAKFALLDFIEDEILAEAEPALERVETYPSVTGVVLGVSKL